MNLNEPLVNAPTPTGLGVLSLLAFAVFTLWLVVVLARLALQGPDSMLFVYLRYAVRCRWFWVTLAGAFLSVAGWCKGKAFHLAF